MQCKQKALPVRHWPVRFQWLGQSQGARKRSGGGLTSSFLCLHRELSSQSQTVGGTAIQTDLQSHAHIFVRDIRPVLPQKAVAFIVISNLRDAPCWIDCQLPTNHSFFLRFPSPFAGIQTRSAPS